MNHELAKRMQGIQMSLTMAISEKAKKLRQAGKPIISLSAGEPNFTMPEAAKQAAIAALEQGFTKYTATDGIVELKDAIIANLAKENQLNYERGQIIVSAGAKQGLYNLMQVLLNPGDEVIIPAPYWVSYVPMVQLAQAKPVIVNCPLSARFKITAEQLQASITDKTKLFILNNPNNPTGMCYNREEILALAEVLNQHPQIYIASDDIYKELIWNGEFHSIANVGPDLLQRTFIFDSCSKSHAMPGMRIGYTAGPEPVIAAMKTLQSQSTSNPNSIAQKAALAALQSDQSWIGDMKQAYQQRQDLLYNGLNQLSGCECVPADGAFYVFADVSAKIKQWGLKDDLAFSAKVLDEIFVAMVPGSAFGAPGHVRLSCAAAEEDIRTALERLNKLWAD